MTGWHPTADDLRLPRAPENQRERLRERLRPWLAKLHRVDGKAIGINRERCYEIAQSLTATARDPGVEYIEGVWDAELGATTGLPPAYHAWNVVDGIHVDLTEELYTHNGRCLKRFYEPLKSYSYEELLKVDAEITKLDSFDISGKLYLFPKFKEFMIGRTDEESKQFWRDSQELAREKAFQPAVNTFMARFANGTRRNEEKP